MKRLLAISSVLVTIAATSCAGDHEALDIGDSATLEVWTHCGVQFLVEEIDGRFWETTDSLPDEVSPMPAAWRELIDDDMNLSVEVLLVASDRLAVTPTSGDLTIEYQPVQTPPGCD